VKTSTFSLFFGFGFVRGYCDVVDLVCVILRWWFSMVLGLWIGLMVLWVLRCCWAAEIEEEIWFEDFLGNSLVWEFVFFDRKENWLPACYWWFFWFSVFFSLPPPFLRNWFYSFMPFAKNRIWKRKLSGLILQLIFWFVLTETDEHSLYCVGIETVWLDLDQDKNRLNKK
jgi:hypothetical protein